MSRFRFRPSVALFLVVLVLALLSPLAAPSAAPAAGRSAGKAPPPTWSQETGVTPVITDTPLRLTPEPSPTQILP